MVMAPFDYVRAGSYAEAVEHLVALGEDAKILAGGQSLVPMLNLRLARPAVLIDLNPARAGAAIEDTGGSLRLPALTPHRDIVESAAVRERCPVLAEAAREIGNPRVRNRGTIGGSLAHADPTGELACAALALDARVETLGPGGTRTIPAGDFFDTYFTTALAPEEVVTAVELPVPVPGSGAAFTEIVRRASDFAVVGVTAVVSVTGDVVSRAAISLAGVADRVVRATAAEELLAGVPVGGAAFEEAVREAAARAAADVDPESDVHATGAYRRRMVEVLTRRTLAKAASRVGGGR
jgi:carbon-monoxide dehydrogenase medium subunit